MGKGTLRATVSACLSAAFLGACQINETDWPENPCTAPLRGTGTGRPVSFSDPVEGQLSLYIRFHLDGDSLVLTRDTLLAMVGAPYPDAFTYVERVCPEDYLAPDAPPPSSYVLQWVNGNLRPSGYTQLLPFDAYQGFDLRPQGPVLDFRGLRPPEGLSDTLYGRIPGFTLGNRDFDTVSVRVAKDGSLRYWIFTAKDGPLASAQMDPYGSITGWIRVPEQ